MARPLPGIFVLSRSWLVMNDYLVTIRVWANAQDHGADFTIPVEAENASDAYNAVEARYLRYGYWRAVCVDSKRNLCTE